METDEVIIHLIRPDSIDAAYARGLLTAEEKSRADRFHFEKDAVHWVRCRAAVREILGAALEISPASVRITYSPTGKPTLADPHCGLHFNLSHCLDLALLAVSRKGPVGVDLESVDRDRSLVGCEASFCHPEEIRFLPENLPSRAVQLLRIWTAKEAILKALGTGLNHPPETVKIQFDEGGSSASSDLPLGGIEGQVLHELINPGLKNHRAYLSISGQVRRFGFFSATIG